MLSEFNDKLETVTSSPVFALDSFRMPFDFMMTSAGSKVKAHESKLTDLNKDIQNLANNPNKKNKLNKLIKEKARIQNDLTHLKTLKPGHVISRDFRRVYGMNNRVGESATKVLNQFARPINKLVTKMPGIAKPYKFYARGMDAIGVTSLVSPLAEIGVNAVKGAPAPVSKVKHAQMLKAASINDKAYMYNKCREYPEEFCLSSKDSYQLMADRIFNQDSYMFEDKGFINGGFRPMPELESEGTPYYIRLVYTEPDSQGQGVAKQMISSMIDSHPSKDGYWMMVNEDNAGMQKCASSLGFLKIHELIQEDNHITDILYLRG